MTTCSGVKQDRYHAHCVDWEMAERRRAGTRDTIGTRAAPVYYRACSRQVGASAHELRRGGRLQQSRVS